MFRSIEARAASSILVIAVWIFVGTNVYHYLEDWTWNEAFYFTVVTLTTVGYGDLHPTTATSRTFTAIFLLTGVAVVLAALGVVGSGMLNRQQERIARRREARGEDEN